MAPLENLHGTHGVKITIFLRLLLAWSTRSTITLGFSECRGIIGCLLTVFFIAPWRVDCACVRSEASIAALVLAAASALARRECEMGILGSAGGCGWRNDGGAL